MATASPEPAAPPSLSVVVCAFDTARRPLLRRCLDAVAAQLRPGDELIVVIDHNDVLLAAGGPGIWLPNRFGRGLSGARNTGLAAAHAEIVAFVDDDAEITAGWADRTRAHYRDPAVLGVGGRATPQWPDTRPDWFPEEFDWVVGCSHRGLPTATAPVRNVLGATMSFRREAVRQAGGFDARVGRVGALPIGCEETELCIRLRARAPAGQILLDPEIVVRHTVSPDRVRLAYFVRRCFGEGRSKAVMGTLVGTAEGLRSERHYVRRVLPAALLRGVAGILIGPARGAHLQRSAVLILGLLATSAGYVQTRLSAVVPT